MTTLKRIKDLLTSHEVAFKALHHRATRTSEESAAVRGEALAVGAKAILMKVGDRFALFVISAAQQIDGRKIRAFLGVKKTRFATAEELMDVTGLVPGSVPPFGRPILEVDLYVDPSVTANDRVAFNAGSLTDSIIMTASDYRRVVDAVFFDFARTRK
jgi:prolyl-tRNA editing enzyme YbaK/EbsC (Cys-tRNA(Pro) deacylase)